jgi:hypothetical protein
MPLGGGDGAASAARAEIGPAKRARTPVAKDSVLMNEGSAYLNLSG